MILVVCPVDLLIAGPSLSLLILKAAGAFRFFTAVFTVRAAFYSLRQNVSTNVPTCSLYQKITTEIDDATFIDTTILQSLYQLWNFRQKFDNFYSSFIHTVVINILFLNYFFNFRIIGIQPCFIRMWYKNSDTSDTNLLQLV